MTACSHALLKSLQYAHDMSAYGDPHTQACSLNASFKLIQKRMDPMTHDLASLKRIKAFLEFIQQAKRKSTAFSPFDFHGTQE
ncbi:MAG: hypothetical protein D6704_07205 [Nitrospirae bacterium]|nr:MAG: hypothetical protein D6704_07205 [Nitrospirota bacterium]